MRPTHFIWIGMASLLAGWFAIFFMLLEMLPPSFLLGVASYALTLIGLALGLYGLALRRR